MIELGEIWSDIRNDELVRKTKFDPNFLSLIAEIVKKNGYHEAKLYLWDFHASREDLREQALALVSVLNRIEKDKFIRKDRSVGSYILKELMILKSTEI